MSQAHVRYFLFFPLILLSFFCIDVVYHHHDGRSLRHLHLKSQVWWAQVRFDFCFFFTLLSAFYVSWSHPPTILASTLQCSVSHSIYIYSKFTNNVYQQIDYVYGHPTLGLNGQWRERVSEMAGELEGGGGRSFQPWKAQQNVQSMFLDYR